MATCMQVSSQNLVGNERMFPPSSSEGRVHNGSLGGSQHTGLAELLALKCEHLLDLAFAGC